MAELEITLASGGDPLKYPRLLDAEVEVLNDDCIDPEGVNLTPIIQFDMKIPFHGTDDLAKWALAPAGANRYAGVKLTLYGRDRSISRVWAMQAARVVYYREVEFPSDPHNATQQENIMHLVVRGLVADASDYSGQNIAAMNKTPEQTSATPPPDAAPTALPDEEQKKTWIEIRLTDDQGMPVPNERYRVRLPDGTIRDGVLDGDGRARVDGIEEGQAEVSFPDRGTDWRPA